MTLNTALLDGNSFDENVVAQLLGSTTPPRQVNFNSDKDHQFAWTGSDRERTCVGSEYLELGSAIATYLTTSDTVAVQGFMPFSDQYRVVRIYSWSNTMMDSIIRGASNHRDWSDFQSLNSTFPVLLRGQGDGGNLFITRFAQISYEHSPRLLIDRFLPEVPLTLLVDEFELGHLRFSEAHTIEEIAHDGLRHHCIHQFREELRSDFGNSVGIRHGLVFPTDDTMQVKAMVESGVSASMVSRELDLALGIGLFDSACYSLLCKNAQGFRCIQGHYPVEFWL